MKYYFVPGLFLLGTLFFGYLYIVGPDPYVTTPGVISPKTSGNTISYNKLEQYKKEAQVKLDIQKQRAEIEKTVEKPLLDPNYRKRTKFHEAPVNADVGPAAYDLNEEGINEPVNLDQQMDAFLAKKQRYEELEKEQRQRYVKAFIKEAYKMGYVVKVNDKMEIVSVDKHDNN